MKESNPKHSLDDYDFGELAKTESNARARTRLYILHQYRIGKHSFEIAENLSINIETARRTRRRYQASGLDSLYDKPRTAETANWLPSTLKALNNWLLTAKQNGVAADWQDKTSKSLLTSITKQAIASMASTNYWLELVWVG